MRILYVSSSDRGGGAEKVALELFEMANEAGHEAALAVGQRHDDAPKILSFDNDNYRATWPRFWRGQHNRQYSHGSTNLARLSGWIANLGEPRRWLEWHLGYEDYNYPGISHLFDRLPFQPDIVHLHNLHGNYFDLRSLRWITKRYPVVLTLHDDWAFTGHCAYSFDCQRWLAGCGECPDLTTYPSLKRDGTGYNLIRKKEIYADSRLHVAAVSQWLIDRARKSVLGGAMVESKVIPCGVDLDIFKPVDKIQTRRLMNIPDDALVVLFIANRAVTNQYKDYSTLEQSIRIVGSSEQARPLYFIAVGEEAPETVIGSAILRRYGYQRSAEAIAKFYQVADIYIHAARAEAFGLVIAEAMACQLPVVATAVGGIPEVVDDQITGFLVARGDSRMMAEKLTTLLDDPQLRLKLGATGRQKAVLKYDRNRHFSDYLEWYRSITEG